MSGATGVARVIVVEDNAALRAFVSAALHSLDIDLLVCAGVTEAMQALASARLSGQGAQLVLTDLVLHRESGLSLIEQLIGDAALHNVARVAVFSGSVDPGMRERLANMGVRHVLPKPASAAALQAFVLQALSDSEPQGSGEAALARQPVADAAGESAEVQAIARFFGGDASLHAAFKASCALQFHDDVLAGDLACQCGDAQGLRRLGHTLGTVLDTLGYAEPASLAQDLDRQATEGDLPHAGETWGLLRSELLRLASR